MGNVYPKGIYSTIQPRRTVRFSFWTLGKERPGNGFLKRETFTKILWRRLRQALREF
jgi:hypothetical protein